jgi:hypothetical protein
MSPDFVEMLSALSEARAEFLVVAIGDLDVPVLGKSDLIRNKRAVGRPQDLLDVTELEGKESGGE